MYEYLVDNPVLAIIFLILVVAVVVFLAVKAIQNIGLEKIRAFAYQKFIEAEHEFQYGENEQKFDYVVQLARSAIPAPFSARSPSVPPAPASSTPTRAAVWSATALSS